MDKRKKVLIIGAVVIVVGLLGLGAGASAEGKVDQLRHATTLKTAEASQRAGTAATDASFVSVRGRTLCNHPLIAPVSGKPCLSYSYSVNAEWTEAVADKSKPGKTTTETRSKSLGGDTKSAEFAIDDGSGPVRIAVQGSSDIERKETPKESYVSQSSNEPSIILGNLTCTGAGLPGGTRFTATERILEPVDSLFACGQLANGALGSSSLILSTKTIQELIDDNAATAATTSAIGWACLVLGALTLVYALLFVKVMTAPIAAPLPSPST